MRSLIFLSCLALLACGDPQPTSAPQTTAPATPPAEDAVAQLGGVWVNSDADIMILADDGSLHWLSMDALQGLHWQADNGMLTLHSIARKTGNAVTQVLGFQFDGDQLMLAAPLPKATEEVTEEPPEEATDDPAEDRQTQRWQRQPGAAASVTGEVRLPGGHSPPSQAVLALSLEKQSSDSADDGAIQRRVTPLTEDSASYRLYYDPAALDDGDILHIHASIIADGTPYYGAREPVPPPTQADNALILELSPMGPGRSNGAPAQ
ncbi:hypothetical protein K8B33_09600 [Alcanivorax sp. JB21]|uniref:hypothetical protein n=1 Tax=Alcanivorax limicola TaxID=2874102 RepID=UPI001CBC2B16|nr:hypothetical protein [Alcanivorax limicola]MBZ2189352.1 hypothetical protein [Alcanivorax limicola]